MTPRAIALAAVLAASQSGAQTPPTIVFSSAVEAVFVDVFVTRDGQPLAGLAAGQFELKDNGVRQNVELLSAETKPLRAVLVFDTSSSMTSDRMEMLRAAGRAFLDGLRPADEVALVTFGEEILWSATPTADKKLVRNALQQLRSRGTTAAFDALYAGIALSDHDRRPLIVLFTDGVDNSSWLDQAQMLKLAERSNALVHVVCWMPAAQAPFNQRMPAFQRVQPTPVPVETDQELVWRPVAEVTGGRFWSPESPEELRKAFAAIADAMGHRYVLRYEPTGVKREGWHRIEIRLRGPKGKVEARRGYWVASPPPVKRTRP